jgi:hypothetical protein
MKQFSRGYVVLKTKKFKHQYPDGKFEWVTCEYQPVDELFVNVTSEILTEHGAKPSEVEKLYFTLGGDHGKEAFRLCFQAIVLLKSGKLLYQDYGGAGLVKGKDDRDILDATLMPWLMEDLRRLNSKRVLISVLPDGTIGCTLEEQEDRCSLAEGVCALPPATIINTGDLKWMAMLLGMDDMSGEWCIFCMLRQMEWLKRQVGEEQTIKKILELARQNLSGPDRKGVKFEPY